MNQTSNISGFSEIINRLADLAVSPQGKERAGQLSPALSETELQRNMRDTSQSRQLLERLGTPPLPAMDSIREYTERAVKGEMLMPGELASIGTFLAAVQRMKSYLERGKELRIPLAFYEENLTALEGLRSEIDKAIRGDEIDDYASPLLGSLRREMRVTEEKITEKAESVLRANKSYMAEQFIVKRNGKICLPVKKEYKSRISGLTAGQSSTGSTVFIEPSSVAKLREQLELLETEEDNEERRILYTLADFVAVEKQTMYNNLDMLAKLDFIFAKGKLSLDMDGVEPGINTEQYLELQGARHPLLPKETCVPLDFRLGKGKRGLIITGPNTGGKTVAVKTVGLLSLMAGSGLHVPCEKADICMFNQILWDIGDGQNITDNLSTFSAHIKNVLDILYQVTGESLVLLDELGSGTDPAEGMGIAVAVLERLRLAGCLFLVTTHYPEVKNYAGEHEEIMNARMAFDRENLNPLYRLEMGKAGESCALFIARKLGMPRDMIRMAAQRAYGAGELADGIERELGTESGEPDKTKKRLLPPKLNLAGSKGKKGSHDSHGISLAMGDSVAVQPGMDIGIVVKPADEKGDVLVQIKGEKQYINHKRLELKASAKDLYPQDYDFSIIFDTVENRKARHQMGRKYVSGLEIQVSENPK